MNIVQLAIAARNTRLTPIQVKKYKARMTVFNAECERKHQERKPDGTWYERQYTV